MQNPEIFFGNSAHTAKVCGRCGHVRCIRNVPQFEPDFVSGKLLTVYLPGVDPGCPECSTKAKPVVRWRVSEFLPGLNDRIVTINTAKTAYSRGIGFEARNQPCEESIFEALPSAGAL